MKKKLLNLLLVILLLVTIPGTLALASNVTGALYRMGITVSNNGTLENYVSTTGNISTPNLIAGNFTNAAVDNIAVQDAATNDVIFMPGHTTNPWCFWVETIGADSYVNYNLYTATSTGGTIAYFPDTTGMIVSDNSTLELGSDFEIETLGWVDTSLSGNETLVYKQGAFRTYIDGATNVTSRITSSATLTETLAPSGAGSETNITNLVGAATHWQATLTNDDDTSYVAGEYSPATGWYRDLYATTDSAIGDGVIHSVTVYNVLKWVTYEPLGVKTAIRTNGVSYDGTEGNVTNSYATYSTVYTTNPQTGVAWTWAEVNAMEIGGSSHGGSGGVTYITQVYAIVSYSPFIYVTATGIASGEYTVKTYGVANEPQWATGDVLHFTGANNSNIDAGDIGDGNKLWMSLWFNLDTAIPTGGTGTDQYLIGKYTDADEFLLVWIEGADGKIYLSHDEVLGAAEEVSTVATTWALGWHHVLASCSTTVAVGQRLIIDGVVAAVPANVTAISQTPSAFCIGARDNGVNAEGFIGEIQNVVLGIGDLSTDEEDALYAGIAPIAGANIPTNYWYIDEGTGTGVDIVIDYGTAPSHGDVDAACSWETATFTTGKTGRLCDFYIEVDDGVADPDRWGTNLKGASVPPNNNDWEFFLNDCMPYVKSLDITTKGVLHGSYDLTKYLPTSNVIDRSYYGLELDGNDYVTMTNDASLLCGTAMTVLIWVNGAAHAGVPIAQYDYGTNERCWEIIGMTGADAGKVNVIVSDDGTIGAGHSKNYVSGLATYLDSTWNLIGFTWDGSLASTNRLKLYLDGTYDDTTAKNTDDDITTIFPGTNDILIGARQNAGVEVSFFTGYVDEVQIYNRALDATEINSIYNGGVGTYTLPSTSGLVLQLHMEEGDGVATADTSGEGNNGAITGATWVNGKVPRPADSSGTNDGTASFRTTSSDANVIATAVSFVPIEEAKAPAWTLDTTVATWATAPVITGNFTTTPGPTYPGASVITDIAAASGTPAQLPFTILFGFLVLALSLIVTYLMRQSSAGSLLVKFLVIAFAMWIGIVLNVIDFWMLLFFVFMALAILAASKQGALI